MYIYTHKQISTLSCSVHCTYGTPPREGQRLSHPFCIQASSTSLRSPLLAFRSKLSVDVHFCKLLRLRYDEIHIYQRTKLNEVYKSQLIEFHFHDHMLDLVCKNNKSLHFELSYILVNQIIYIWQLIILTLRSFFICPTRLKSPIFH